MSETPLFLGKDACQLFGVVHEPNGERSGEAFVFCHPLGEEKLWTHRVFVSFARVLAASGHTVLRVDLMGNGDSCGEFSEASVETAVADVRCAIEEICLRSGAAGVTLLGLRFGATIAALVAERVPSVNRLVLWAPIVDGERYMQELLRTNVATQTAVYKEVRHDRAELVGMIRRGQTVNIDGYEMGHALYAEASAINLVALPKGHKGPCLVVQVDRQPGRPAPELHALASSYAQGVLLFAQEEPFWKEIARFYDRAPSLYDVTTGWLRSTGSRA